MNTSADSAQSVFAADIDGDGHRDLASASASDDKIAWYRNVNGDGSSWTTTVVTTSANTRSVFAADIDGDGRMDLASVFLQNCMVSQCEWRWVILMTTVVTTSADGAISVFAADIDGDGRMDLASASSSDDQIAWYRNVNGDGSSWTTTVVTTNADGALIMSVFAADIDGDGRMDLASASFQDDKIAWYRNVNGSGLLWETTVVTTSANLAKSVFAADIDGDGHMDLASVSTDIN